MIFISVFLVALFMLSAVSFGKEKVIFDTDTVQMIDDGVAMMMLALSEDIDLLGVTVLSGNKWVEESVAYALDQLELINKSEVPVYIGAAYPLRPNRSENIELEQKLYGVGNLAYRKSPFSHPRPDSHLDILVPPHGGYPSTEPMEQDAINFIIDTIRENPGEVTICAVGPLTNIALAIRVAPDIIPLVKKIVYMGGAFDVPGNITPAAEYNWWFDPEAAKMVLNAEWNEQLIVPLDVCMNHPLPKSHFDQLVAADNAIGDRFEYFYGENFRDDPNHRRLTFDMIAAGWILDPNIVKVAEERWVDMNDVYSLDYGRSLSYKEGQPYPAGVQKATILFDIHSDVFYDNVVELLSQPIY